MKTIEQLIECVPNWIERAHKQAVKSGFHPEEHKTDLTERALRVLIKSELYEAHVWERKCLKYNDFRYFYVEFGKPTNGIGKTSTRQWKLNEYIEFAGHNPGFRYEAGLKPDSIPHDLADFLIRVFDYAGLNKIYETSLSLMCRNGAYRYLDLNDFIEDHEKRISLLDTNDLFLMNNISDCVELTFLFCQQFKIDIYRAIEEKMAYNATRPYKHGKKF